MDEFEVLTTFFTPASDLVLGDVVEADGETIFGRAGNDALRAYPPQAINAQGQNIDFLFGDIVDNSLEERDLIFAIQDGTNPLGILDTGPPSVGEDRFILGDTNGSYYDDDISGATSDDPFNNFFGLNDYSVLYDFNPEQDTIQLNGSPEDYVLAEINDLPVEGISQPFSGEAIFLRKENRLDLVSYVISTPEVDLNLNDDNFEYVDEASPPSLEQAGQIGTPGIDLSYGSATDSEGNLYLTGTTSGSLGGESQGGFDVWVVKYDRQGQELWKQQFGTLGSDRSYGIEIDSEDNFYLTGQTDGDLFGDRQSTGTDGWVAKFDGSSGEQIWGRQYGTNVTDGFANASFDLAVDDEGSVYASGTAIKENTGVLPPEIFDFPVEDDAFVLKFDTNGNQEWFTELRSPIFDESYGIDVDDDGNVYATGWTQGLVRESDPGRFLLKYDYWLSQLDADNGEVESSQQFNSSDSGLEFAWDVETDSGGNAIVGGWTTGDISGSNGSYDPFLAKYNPDGTQEWVRQFGTGGDDGLFTASFDIDEQDNIYVTGYTDSDLGGANQGEYDTWVAKYDPEGTQQWTQQLGTGDREYGTDVTANEFGEVFVTGFTDGSLGQVNAGAEDAWVAKLSADSGDIESFADDMQGGRGVIGQEPDDGAVEIENGQISEAAITDSLEEVFAPDEEFTDSLGDSLNENSDDLILEDENGVELDESEIERIEGIEDEDTTPDDADVVEPLEDDTSLTEDTSDEIAGESTAEDNNQGDEDEDLNQETAPSNNTNDEQLSQDGITGSLNDLFAPDEEFIDSLGDSLNKNSDDLLLEDENGVEPNETEIEEIEGIENDDTQSNNEDLVVPNQEDTASTEDVSNEVIAEPVLEDDGILNDEQSS